MRSIYETDPDILLNHTYSFSNVVLRPCNIEEYNHIGREVGTVDLRDVVGVTNPNYFNLKWGDVLRNKWLQHPFDTLHRLQKTPEYFLSEEKKDGWYFAKINGKIYIDGGNHRTLIGRAFLEYNNLSPVIHGVTIESYMGNLKPEDIFHDHEPKKKFDLSGWLLTLVCVVGLISYKLFFRCEKRDVGD